MREALTFDDVLLVPHYSTIESRDDVDISCDLGVIRLRVPIVSANMDTVTWDEMAMAMYRSGGLGILHRFATYEQTRAAIVKMMEAGLPTYAIVPSIGVKPGDFDLVKRYAEEFGISAICIDVAHGDTIMALDMVDACANFDSLGAKYDTIIAGNVATPDGALRLVEAGANVVKVGVGPGSVCTTRVVTGHGYPQLSAVMEVYSAVPDHVAIIADGGIRTSGDVVKALAAGADAVMCGYLLAGSLEAPVLGDLGSSKLYRGSASKGANGNAKYVEGVDTLVPLSGPVSMVIDRLEAGIRSGLTYSGARNLRELRRVAEFVRVTHATAIENGPHGRK